MFGRAAQEPDVTTSPDRLRELTDAVAEASAGAGPLVEIAPACAVEADVDAEEGLLHVTWALDGVARGFDVPVRLEPEEDAESLANLIRWEIIERVRTG